MKREPLKRNAPYGSVQRCHPRIFGLDTLILTPRSINLAWLWSTTPRGPPHTPWHRSWLMQSDLRARTKQRHPVDEALGPPDPASLVILNTGSKLSVTTKRCQIGSKRAAGRLLKPGIIRR